MKSLQYLIFKTKPKNLDDCIDFYLKKQESNIKPNIILNLTNPIRVTEEYILQSFVGEYCWNFNNDVEIEYSKVYGGVIEYECEARQQINLDKANLHFQSDLEILSRLDFVVNKSNNKFIIKRGEKSFI